MLRDRTILVLILLLLGWWLSGCASVCPQRGTIEPIVDGIEHAERELGSQETVSDVLQGVILAARMMLAGCDIEQGQQGWRAWLELALEGIQKVLRIVGGNDELEETRDRVIDYLADTPP